MQLQMMDREAFYAPHAFGKTRRITPEGFMVCEGVAIGRIGTQLYRTGDVKGLTYDSRGEARIRRTAEEVFRPESMASYEGKPVTVGHPPRFVTPDTWKSYSVGTVHNVRRGDGVESDCLIADLLITDAAGIAYINKDIDRKEYPECSCGYDCEYTQDTAGSGYQHSIIGNHVALVKRGRAGPRCAIKDEETPMKKTFMDRVSRLFTAVNAEDMAGVGAVLTEDASESPSDTTVIPQAVDARLKSIETAVAELVTAAKAKATADQVAADAAAAAAAQATAEAAAEAARVAALPTYTADQLSAIVSRAEILSPGIAIPAADALAKDAPALMTLALTKATEGASKEFVTPFLLNRELKTLTGDALLGVFMGAAELARVRNNQRVGTGVAATKKTTDSASEPVTAAVMNQRAAALWKTSTQQ